MTSRLTIFCWTAKINKHWRRENSLLFLVTLDSVRSMIAKGKNWIWGHVGQNATNLLKCWQFLQKWRETRKILIEGERSARLKHLIFGLWAVSSMNSWLVIICLTLQCGLSSFCMSRAIKKSFCSRDNLKVWTITSTLSIFWSSFWSENLSIVPPSTTL